MNYGNKVKCFLTLITSGILAFIGNLIILYVDYLVFKLIADEG